MCNIEIQTESDMHDSKTQTEFHMVDAEVQTQQSECDICIITKIKNQQDLIDELQEKIIQLKTEQQQFMSDIKSKQQESLRLQQ